jgi:hypothetical protein
VIVERLVHEAKLAWAVAEAAKPYLSAVERDAVFVAIGAGETFAAIRQLLRSVEIKRIPLRPDLLHYCRTWLHGYFGHEDERYLLRRLIEEPLIPYAITPPATIRATRMPATPTSATPPSMAPTQVGERPCAPAGAALTKRTATFLPVRNGSANAASAPGISPRSARSKEGCRMINDTRMALVILALFAFGIFLLAICP